MESRRWSSYLLPFYWNALLLNYRYVSNERQNREEFLGRMYGSQQAEMFESLKLTISHMVTGQELVIFDKPVP